MKTIGLERISLDSCVDEAQQEHIIITRKGKPVALIIGIDKEQLDLGRDDTFWKLIEERRNQDTVSREELERLINSS